MTMTTTTATIRTELIAHVRDRLNSNPQHGLWSKQQRLAYELGYMMGILVVLAERDPKVLQELRARIDRTD
jgi:hypothetical protein